MKKSYLLMLVVVTSLATTACSDEKPRTFADPQIKSMEKAQDVEQLLQQSAEDQQKQVEDQLR